MIEVDDRVGCGIDAGEVAGLIAEILAAEGAPGAEVGVLFLSVDAMRDLNRAHRARDEATDVLAFPIDEGGPMLDGVPQMLGDVVVCPAVALEQAAEAGVEPGTEVTELIVHGTLHLLGYDHERDDGEMLARQAELVRSVDILGWGG
jgi:probable rRNA maturation factor